MTIRTLILVRHAKAKKVEPRPAARADRTSRAEQAELADRARPLTSRGRRDARKTGKRLAKLGVAPALIWVSPAERALETVRIMARKLRYPRKRIRVDPRLYATSVRRMADLLSVLSSKLSCVLICGHNPELQRLARRLGAGLEELPTCGVVMLDFDIRRWSEASRRTLLEVTLLPVE